jgi:DNA ligase (NAD+)
MNPSKGEASDRARALRKQISHHRKKYYQDDAPEISDAEYDALERELKTIEAAHPDLVTPDSSSQRVGGEPSDSFVNVRHHTPLLSLDNAYSDGELRAWDERLTRAVGHSVDRYVVEPKIDGLSIALWYREGVLERAVTRGDGFVVV